jgi:hypothetical protein
MVQGVGFHYPCHWFSRPGGPGLLTTRRGNDFELIDRPVGRGLTLNDYSRGRLLTTARLFYIAVAGSSLREAQTHKHTQRKVTA